MFRVANGLSLKIELNIKENNVSVSANFQQ